MNKPNILAVMALSLNMIAAAAIGACSVANATPAVDAMVADQAPETPPAISETQTFGRSQFALAGDPIVPPRDYDRGTMLPRVEDYSSQESGSIYDIVYVGIQRDQIEFEIRGYSIDDLLQPVSGQQFTFPIDSKNIQLRNIVIAIEDVQPGSLTYRAELRTK
jgi:hypothetical protein